MPRNLNFWELKRVAADKKLRELHKQLQEVTITRAPKRRLSFVAKEVGFQALPHGEWRKRYIVWKTFNARRREIMRSMDKLRRRVAYYDERIATLRKTNAWTAVLANRF